LLYILWLKFGEMNTWMKNIDDMDSLHIQIDYH
jgi:hypothetical protein